MPSPFYAEVVATERVSPHFIRLTFGGAEMDRFHDTGFDQWFRLFLPRDGEDKPRLPDFNGDAGLRTWYNSTPADQRPIIRNYTVRHFDRQRRQLKADFLVHSDAGPACDWAQRAAVGDIIGLYQQGAMLVPRADTDWFLFITDATGLPAVAGCLDSLGPARPARVYCHVPQPDDRQELPAPTHWYHGDDHTEIIDAVRAAEFAPGTVQAFIAGESGMVQTLRRHLVADRGIDKDRVTFCGYWRHRLSAED